MRISNLVTSTRLINQQISAMAIEYCKTSDHSFSEDEIDDLLETIQAIVTKIRRLCQKDGSSPADLPTPSFRAYQWLEFLSQRKWLLSHLYAVAEFYNLMESILPNSILRNRSAAIQISCYHSSYLFRSSRKDGKVYLEINEGYISAPATIKQTILAAALKRRTSARLKVIKDYTAKGKYKQIHAILQGNSGANQLAVNGRVYNLVDVFNQVNQEYFKNQITQPRLVWSSRKSTRRLGYYHPESDTITINKRLDSRDIPSYLVEFVMYHEMLHKKIGLKEVNGRRYAHTKAFKEAEKKFAYYHEAEESIKKLNQSRH